MSTELMSQIFMLFGLMAIGYLCGKTRIMDETANAKFSGFLLKVSLPATILSSAISQSSMDLGLVRHVTLTAIGVFILLPIVSKILGKLFHLNATYELMLNYSNLGFMGLPIISSIYGEESSFFVAIFMMIFNIHIFTYGIINLQGKPDNLMVMLKKLCTPGIISALLAFVIVLLHLAIPAPVAKLAGSLGSVTIPLAMIIIGSQLAYVQFREVLTKPSLYFMSLLKLVVYPVIVYLALRLVIGPGMVTEISTILMGLPVAANVTMICSEYDGDVALAAQGTCVSTLFSLLTIPIMLSVI